MNWSRDRWSVEQVLKLYTQACLPLEHHARTRISIVVNHPHDCCYQYLDAEAGSCRAVGMISGNAFATKHQPLAKKFVARLLQITPTVVASTTLVLRQVVARPWGWLAAAATAPKHQTPAKKFTARLLQIIHAAVAITTSAPRRVVAGLWVWLAAAAAATKHQTLAITARSLQLVPCKFNATYTSHLAFSIQTLHSHLTHRTLASHLSPPSSYHLTLNLHSYLAPYALRSHFSLLSSLLPALISRAHTSPKTGTWNPRSEMECGTLATGRTMRSTLQPWDHQAVSTLLAPPNQWGCTRSSIFSS